MNSSKHLTKKLSLFLSVMLTANLCPMTSIAADSSKNGKTSKGGAIEKAAEYIETQLNTDSSFGSSNIINDTAYALSALKIAGAEGH